MNTIRIRIETLLKEKGLNWPEVYKSLGWHKSLASRVINGIIIPKPYQRIALANKLNCDTSVIWDEPILISAYNLLKSEAHQ